MSNENNEDTKVPLTRLELSEKISDAKRIGDYDACYRYLLVLEELDHATEQE